MLRGNPALRVSSQTALVRWNALKMTKGTDGPFFESVVSLMEQCEVRELPPTAQRPLHFVATFRRNVSLGLILSEADTKCTDPNWIQATKDAQPGEVFVQSLTPGCQADQMGILEVGDRLQGVGELPLAGKGFERVVEMLEQQPKSAKYVTLHFDRQPRASQTRREAKFAGTHARVVEQGAWSTKGRRKAQEDTFGMFLSVCSTLLLYKLLESSVAHTKSFFSQCFMKFMRSKTFSWQASLMVMVVLRHRMQLRKWFLT